LGQDDWVLFSLVYFGKVFAFPCDLILIKFMII
jgi:hypothetical protein